MDDDFELIEFQYPSVFAAGTYVKVIKIVDHPGRGTSAKMLNMVGQMGIVHSHKTASGARWNRVSMDQGGRLDFLTQELQKVV